MGLKFVVFEKGEMENQIYILFAFCVCVLRFVSCVFNFCFLFAFYNVRLCFPAFCCVLDFFTHTPQENIFFFLQENA